MHKRILLLSVLIMAVIMSSCSRTGESETTAAVTSVEEQQSSTQETTVENTPTVPEEAGFTLPEGFSFPEQGKRPVAVMIDNEGSRVLPQGGLNKAQLVYEIIVEGGLSRIMPVFWNADPTMIGPVRSSRHYFLDYAMEHDAIYVHFGWSPQAREDIPKLGINNINGLYVDSVFWELTKDPGNWQDSYTSMERIKSYIEKVKYRTETETAFPFNYNNVPEELSDGTNAGEINIKYSSAYNCGFIYDNESGMYKRVRYGKPQMERVSEKQLEAMNIIIQHVHNSTIKGDKEDRQELKTVGSGKGYFITRGKAIEITWSKDSRKGASKYTDAKGNEIVLNPGQTWIQVVPINAKITIE